MPTRRSATIAAVLALLAAPAVADPARFAPLAESDFAGILPYIGKIAVLPPEPTIFGTAATCSAVAVAPEWILTAAHCVYRVSAAGRPWTPDHFDGMEPLSQIIFRPAPIGTAPLYRIVEVVQSDRFPDPAAVEDDWIFLRLHRPLEADPARLPVILPGEPPEGAVLHISGFVRTLRLDGTVDPGASNAALVSRLPCAPGPFEDETLGRIEGVAALDCIPAVNFGLSGAPLFAIGAGGRPAILGIQTGAGIGRGTGTRFPVYVASRRFVSAWRQILAAAP